MEWLAGESRLEYADQCLKAALDTNTFQNFRKDPQYKVILEHVDARTGLRYLKAITDCGYSIDDVFEIIEPLQFLGNPILHDIGVGRPVSTTALRYLKVGIDIISQFGTDLGMIVEIGCGFGGQAIILSKLASIQHYTFVDMWQVNLLIQRFIETSDFNVEYEIKTIRQASSRLNIDYVISNYAFSEFDIQLQSLCLKKFVLNSKHGYLTMNTGLNGMAFNGQASRHVTSDILMSLIPSAKQASEKPETSPSNYIITW